MPAAVKRNVPVAVILLVGLGFVMAINEISPFIYLIWPVVMGTQFAVWYFAGKETVYRENRRVYR